MRNHLVEVLFHHQKPLGKLLSSLHEILYCIHALLIEHRKIDAELPQSQTKLGNEQNQHQGDDQKKEDQTQEDGKRPGMTKAELPFHPLGGQIDKIRNDKPKQKGPKENPQLRKE
ncbi:hypothetical protein SDC9_179865 [bioreactor metagenome]|uniref:Uncharacterized protein n=1 Tax=bioreactor metagenome TaxID=1076179 RepID=A0A645H020_9ZZZZ